MWAEAISLLSEAATLEPPPEAHVVILAELGRISAATGDFERAHTSLAECEDVAMGSPRVDVVSLLSLGWAELGFWTGSPDRGLNSLAQALALLGATDDVDWYLDLAQIASRLEAEAAITSRRSGDKSGTAEAFDRVSEIVRRAKMRSKRTGTLSPLRRSRLLTLEAERRRAAGMPCGDLFREAARAYDATGEAYSQLYCRWRAVEDQLPSEDARSELPRLHRDAMALGAVPLADGVRRLARRARVALDETVTSHEPQPAGLTAREVQVLALMYARATNREIGELLFISEKTVATHVSRILQKLGAKNRREAGRIGERLGIRSIGAVGPITDGL
jgi:ATP/maltotriose-dependent transcriptional regulator MalT